MIGRRPLRQLAQRRDVEVAVAQQRHRARDRRRGHVQHVRHEPLRRLGVERRALAHAEAVLLVDDDDREAVEAHVGLEQRVRADDERQLAATRACASVSARRDALVEPVSSATRTASPGISACSVAKCCSASTSVGAMKTACASCSTARRIACSATTVLPEPTSPISRRCIGRGWASSSSSTAIAARWSPVSSNGSSCSRQRRDRPGAPSSAVRAARRAALGAAAQQRQLREQQLVEGQPAAAALEVAGVRGDAARRCGRAGAAARRRRAGSGVDGVVRGGAGARARARGSASRTGRRSPGSARPRWPEPVLSAVGACPSTRKRVARGRACRAAPGACPWGTCAPATAG